MRLSDIIVESSRAALSTQERDGSFPAGHNGPYRDPETPVRTTGHWAITLLHAFRLTQDDVFAEASHRAVGYLLSRAARPMDATFFCRMNPDKDMSNGLVGQAWTIEALAAVGKALVVPEALEVAREVFLLHPFDEQAGVWRGVNVDGSRAPFDLTFNHQLWFAAAGSLLPSDPVCTERVTRFLDVAAGGLLRVNREGRIRHEFPSPWLGQRTAIGLRATRRRVTVRGSAKAMAAKELGYQSFNLYALGLLRQRLAHHPLWGRPAVGAALAYVNREQYERGLEDNVFAYPYNPSGFEVAYATEVFATLAWRRDPAWWVEQQLRRSYDLRAKALTRGTTDPVTLAARLYEATRLSDVTVRLDGAGDSGGGAVDGPQATSSTGSGP